MVKVRPISVPPVTLFPVTQKKNSSCLSDRNHSITPQRITFDCFLFDCVYNDIIFSPLYFVVKKQQQQFKTSANSKIEYVKEKNEILRVT